MRVRLPSPTDPNTLQKAVRNLAESPEKLRLVARRKSLTKLFDRGGVRRNRARWEYQNTSKSTSGYSRPRGVVPQWREDWPFISGSKLLRGRTVLLLFLILRLPVPTRIPSLDGKHSGKEKADPFSSLIDCAARIRENLLLGGLASWATPTTRPMEEEDTILVDSRPGLESCAPGEGLLIASRSLLEAWHSYPLAHPWHLAHDLRNVLLFLPVLYFEPLTCSLSGARSTSYLHQKSISTNNNGPTFSSRLKRATIIVSFDRFVLALMHPDSPGFTGRWLRKRVMLSQLMKTMESTFAIGQSYPRYYQRVQFYFHIC